MSDAPVLIPGTTPAGTPVTDDGDPLAPPDDMGASVLAEFARREKATAAAAGKDLGGLTGDGPPGGFPDINDAAANVTARVDVSQAGQDPTALPGSGPTAVAQSAAALPPESPTGSSSASGDAASVGVAGAASSSLDPADGTQAAPAVPGQPGSEGAGPTAPVTPDTAGEPAPAVSEPSGYTWTFNDGQADRVVQFDDAQVQRALGVAAWAENLPEPVKHAIGSIETGQAVAIPRADYDEFAAWKAQQSRTTRDADLDQLQSNLDLDPVVVDLLRKQRDELDAFKAQQQSAQPTIDPQYQMQVNAGADRTAQQVKAAQESYAQMRGLTFDETEGLLGAAVHAQIIPSLVEANTIVNPANGNVLVPADMGKVAEQALDWALIRNPHLKTRVLAHQQTPGQVQQGAQLPAAVQSSADAAVQARKARAGSLASAPAGVAPPLPAQTVAQMTPQDITAAMARDIEAIMASS